ncbi:MAG: DUF1045 domain-containing protein [Gammaproteobacteria bacterium]|nr:DUF1045 domain-containing protein [Gammaproteobacteria bacterium]MBU1442433.1 DUF1045 domain-containing protein [Gammaproteobacteria bacterium]MBU2410373.1 DUF1045 domain-containing protein [Gammaproteobacteria bacterium]
MHRYALYFAPRVDTEWWEAGSRWIGRCAARQVDMPQPPVPGVSAEEQRRWTAAPRRYGWHATLRAPFKLAAQADMASVRAALRLICKAASFDMPTLEVARIDDFLALVPHGDSGAIDAMAARCVIEMDSQAAPLDANDLARRRAAGLTPHEDALLERWGYPYVFDCFRFHMSLTGSLKDASPTTVAALHEAASDWFSGLPPLRFDSVSLFGEPAPGADFVLIEQCGLRA